jgi:hypothetical protein
MWWKIFKYPLNMKKQITLLFLTAIFSICATTLFAQANPDKTKKVQMAIIREVIQTTSYTYLHVKIDADLQWLAVPLATFKSGDTCYFTGGLVMPDFTSKELNRTFDKVIFLEGVSKTAEEGKTPGLGAPAHGTKSKPEKLETRIEPAAGGISIGELYKNKELYNGKTVKIRGKVMKFKPSIMSRNWGHLQDGTSTDGKFDLTVTLKSTLTVGDIVTVEGKVTINKDFGSGYFFEVLMEEGVVK